jgi:hypothetical protein
MADLLTGILLGVLSLVVCFAGLRVFFFALPIVGFIAGFYIGAAVVQSILGDGFLATFTGILIGVIVGLFLAVLSYVFWYIGALLSAASTGALIGSSLMNGLGATSGWAVFAGACIAGGFVLFIAYKLALPIYVVIVNTAFIGASGAIAGLLLIFDQVDRADLAYGTAWATIEESWFWMVAWLVLAVFGLMTQLRSIADFTLPEDRWTMAHAS